MGELVQAKYLHMLRWKRFCEHTSAIESLYPYYQKRMRYTDLLTTGTVLIVLYLLPCSERKLTDLLKFPNKYCIKPCIGHHLVSETKLIKM